MKKNFNGSIILAICISIFLFACNGKDKTEEAVATTESPKTETAAPSDNKADMDAAKVAPDLYKVLKDTLGIRVVEVNYKPGDSSAMHWHPDYVVYALEGGTATFYAKDGTKMPSEMKKGMSMIRAGEFHSVKNTGSSAIKVILFEVNRPSQMNSIDAATDATKVAPTVYKLKNDSLGIRVIEVTAKPGQSIAMHSHPDNALYVIDPGTTEFTAKDGTKTVVELQKGMVVVGPAESHSAKNTGKKTLKVILVEVNRPMK